MKAQSLYQFSFSEISDERSHLRNNTSKIKDLHIFQNIKGIRYSF